MERGGGDENDFTKQAREKFNRRDRVVRRKYSKVVSRGGWSKHNIIVSYLFFVCFGVCAS